MKRSVKNDLGSPALVNCEDCTARCTGGFKKLAHLFGSGVAIYFHTQTGSDQYDNSTQTRKSLRNADTFIVHNTSNTELRRNTVISELSKYKTKCVACKNIIKRVKNLLEEIRAIRRNEIYAICEHCKRSGLNCKRCEYILSKFKESQSVEREQQFKQWLLKVKQLFETISKGNLCQYRLYQDTADAAELDNLLMELDSPLIAQRKLDIRAFPSMEFEENLAQSKDMLHELIQKLKSESGRKQYSSDDSLFVPTSGASCVCKYLMDRKLEDRKSLDLLPQQDTEVSKPVPSKASLVSKPERGDGIKKERTVNEKENVRKGTSAKEASVKEKDKDKKGTSAKEASVKEKDKAKKGSSAKEPSVTDKENKSKLANKSKKSPHSEASNLFKKLLAENKKNKPKPEKQQKVTPQKLPTFGALPKLRSLKRLAVVEEVSESVLECDDELMNKPTDMIKGKTIVPYHEHYKVQEADSVQPLLFKVKADCPEPVVESPQTQTASTSSKKTKAGRALGEDRSGIFSYRLSDRQFIEKGWTRLPATKILRRMNVYKMIPASPYDWFALHKAKGTMLYASGEKLAEIDTDGQGKWFYKSGMVALEYYNSEEVLARKRCVVYGYEACGGKKAKSQTVLACFDYLGNGVVYDLRGNERMKYNQTEGHLIDERIGPPGFWKWHTLNDPPVLQHAFVETYSKDRSTCENIVEHDQENPRARRDANADMLAIELDNFVKEKADKLLQKFKPFQIRMKTVKINEYFSLRVIDQSKIYLLYRDGAVTMKLNLGMLLQSKEIIDTDSVELSSVATPYDRHPARSNSVSKLQDLLLAAKGKKNDDGSQISSV